MLTAPMAAEIRRLRDSSLRPPEIASMVGVSLRTVNEVLAGKRDGRRALARERFEEDGRTGWAPACMEPPEWADWRARNPVAGIPDADQVARPCEECPIGWAVEMRAEGRCNGTPAGVAEDPDQVDEHEEDHAVEHENTPGTRIPVTLEAPCPGCIKSDVCSLRPRVEGLRSASVSISSIDPLVSVALAGTVTCGAFIRAPKAKPVPKPVPVPADADRRTRILEVLERHGGDVAAAAAELGERPNVIARIRNAALDREREQVAS